MRLLALLSGLVLALCAAQAVACTVPADLAGLRGAVQASINAERQRAGAAGLNRSEPLERAAQDHACALARRGQISHRGMLGTGLRTRLWQVGYRAELAGENLAAGIEAPPALVAAWMASPGHRANILMTGARDLGLGAARGRDGMLYWVMVGAAPR